MKNVSKPYTDDEFIAIALEFDTLTLHEQIERLLHFGEDGEGFLRPIKREINKKQYSIGFNVQREGQAQVIARVLHDVLKVKKLEESTKAFALKLQRCETPYEQVQLLEQTIQQTRERLEGAKDTYVYKGYNAARLKHEELLYSWQGISFSNNLLDEALFFSIVCSCSEGHVIYQMEVYLADLLNEIKGVSSIGIATIFGGQRAFNREATPTGLETRAKDGRPIPKPKSSYNWEYFFSTPIDKLFREAETKVLDRVAKWNNKEDKIGCAAFCEVIFNQGWFSKTKPKESASKKTPASSIIKNAIVFEFANWRYEIDIWNQLGTGKTRQRAKHRGKIEEALGLKITR